ncbi:unnamed protein product [Cochlearia groenlandica]
MEKIERESQEETYNLWIPFKCLEQTLKAIFKCFGLLHDKDSSITTKTASSSVSLNQLGVEEEEVLMKEEIIVMSKGYQNGVVITSRGTKVKAKRKDKERYSSGRSGQHG